MPRALQLTVVGCAALVAGCLDFAIEPGTLRCDRAVSPSCPGDWVCAITDPAAGATRGRCYPQGAAPAPADAGPGDAGPGDAGPGDAGPIDVAVRDTGPAVPGFGELCDPTQPSCPGGLTCIVSEKGGGFCSRPCASLGAQCDGTPTGTVAGCIHKTPASSDLFCGFLCQVKDTQDKIHTFPCPGTMVCSTKEDPPGQRSCVP